jgi:hypothetical protein
MYASLEAVIAAIALQQDTNNDAQISAAMTGFPLATQICLLNQDWMDDLSQWTTDYFVDTLKIAASEADLGTISPDPYDTDSHTGGGAAMATMAAQDNQYKSLDQNQANVETGNLNNLEEKVKSMVDFLGGTLQETYSLTAPIFSVIDQAKASTKSLG